MVGNIVPRGRSRRHLCQLVYASAVGSCLLISMPFATLAFGQSSSTVTGSNQLPANWRDIKDGVGGYPAGPMLEIAVRRTHSDKLEMFKWRSEFIAMLSAQPGPLVEREWHSVLSLPENTGAGTWTGMTWWENQQRWQDMANLLFPTPVAEKWLKTLDMTMIFAKPLDSTFDLHTLAQSGGQVLELGVLSFPTSGVNAASGDSPSAAQDYLGALKRNGAETYNFAIYRNPAGVIGPYTVAYNKNGPPASTGEKWFVYMATYDSMADRSRLQSTAEVRRAIGTLESSMIKAHSDLQVMTRTTSQVCIKSKSNTYSLDPDECHVGVMGSADTWAASYGERPQPCLTSYNILSELPPKTCDAVGGRRVDARSHAPRP